MILVKLFSEKNLHYTYQDDLLKELFSEGKKLRLYKKWWETVAHIKDHLCFS